jgi:hypothetical protein
MDTASLVIGIFAVIIGFIPCLQVVVILPALVGLILGAVSFFRKRQTDESTGIAVAGMILNAIPLLVVTTLAVFLGVSSDAYTINDMIIK